MARPREIDRDAVLDAAEAIIIESEGRGFTLDAVAERAGVSKGGLVYSFESKDALIASALERELSRFIASWDARAKSDQDSPEAVLTAYVKEIHEQDETHLKTAALLMTAISNAPHVSEPARRFYRAIFKHFDSVTQRGRDIRQAILAIEGLFLLRGMGLVETGHDEWMSVMDHALGTLRKHDQ